MDKRTHKLLIAFLVVAPLLGFMLFTPISASANPTVLAREETKEINGFLDTEYIKRAFEKAKSHPCVMELENRGIKPTVNVKLGNKENGISYIEITTNDCR